MGKNTATIFESLLRAVWYTEVEWHVYASVNWVIIGSDYERQTIESHNILIQISKMFVATGWMDIMVQTMVFNSFMEMTAIFLRI